MPSMREMIFTPEDEAAFSAALVAKFPHTVFFDKGAWSEPVAQRRASLADCESGNALVSVHERPWTPKLKLRNESGLFIVDNRGPRVLTYIRTTHIGTETERGRRKEATAIYHCFLHVSYGRPTPEMKRFAGQVWRVLGKVASDKLLYVSVPSGRVINRLNADRGWIVAGHRAILWTASRRDRAFSYQESSEFPPDIGCAIVPAPEAIAEARAAVLGEAAPKRARRRTEAGPG